MGNFSFVMNKIVFCGKLDIKCLEIHTRLVDPDLPKERLRMPPRPWPVKDIVYVTFIRLHIFY